MRPDARQQATHHYENFPVGSRWIAKPYREVIHRIYAFARVADDIADEGTAAPSERIDRLDEWQQLLHSSLQGADNGEFFSGLAADIRRYDLPVSAFDDLLVAFRNDSFHPRYSTFDEVLEYCRYSANPIGRLLLRLYGCTDDTVHRYSDLLCTALQLTNFWQDISVDTRRNRVYIPQADLSAFHLNEDDLRTDGKVGEFRGMMRLQMERTRKLFADSAPLITHAPAGLRKETALIWNGGMRLLEKIEKRHGDTRRHRPRLGKWDRFVMLYRTLTR